MAFFIRIYLLLRFLVDLVSFSQDKDSKESENPESNPGHAGQGSPDEDPDEDPEDDKDSTKRRRPDSENSDEDEDELAPGEVLTEDLATLGQAKQGHSPSLEYLEEQYRTFFVGTSSRAEALEQIQSYLEDELSAEGYVHSSVNYANSSETKVKRGLDDDSDEEEDHYANSKRPKIDQDNSGSTSGTSGSASGPSVPNAGPSSSSPNDNVGNSNSRISHDIMFYFFFGLSTIAEAIDNFFSNIL